MKKSIRKWRNAPDGVQNENDNLLMAVETKSGRKSFVYTAGNKAFIFETRMLARKRVAANLDGQDGHKQQFDVRQRNDNLLKLKNKSAPPLQLVVQPLYCLLVPCTITFSCRRAFCNFKWVL